MCYNYLDSRHFGASVLRGLIMTSTKYTMVTVAAVETDFLDEAVKHTGALAEELKAKAGAMSDVNTSGTDLRFS